MLAFVRLVTRIRLLLPRLAALAIVSAVLPLLSGGGASAGGLLPRGATMRVIERDFSIKAPRVVRAGVVQMLVANRGPDEHELIVVRLNSSTLPFRKDGLTVDEDVLEPLKRGGLEPGKPGSVRDLRLRLAPGSYELFCNMAGHYRGGMHVRLVAR